MNHSITSMPSHHVDDPDVSVNSSHHRCLATFPYFPNKNVHGFLIPSDSYNFQKTSPPFDCRAIPQGLRVIGRNDTKTFFRTTIAQILFSIIHLKSENRSTDPPNHGNHHPTINQPVDWINRRGTKTSASPSFMWLVPLGASAVNTGATTKGSSNGQALCFSA